MFDTKQVNEIARAMEIDQPCIKPFIFTLEANEELVDFLKTISVSDDKKITYTFDGKNKEILHGPLVFHRYYDHACVIIGKHSVGRDRKNNGYPFMYNGDQTKIFIQQLEDHINNVIRMEEVPITPTNTPVESVVTDIPVETSSSYTSRCEIM
jgi:hypothetical protein